MAQSMFDLAEQWLQLDRNEATRAEIQKLLEQNDDRELELRLGSRIAFGTSGLRARMEAGFSRMNQLTVIQASQGLAEYLQKIIPNSREKGIVIGHDHRHNSEDFARLTAATFLNGGFKVYFYDRLVHTPLVPFGVKHLKAAGGVMITASHNPAADNGYKVYWSNACAIIPPHDRGIAACISQNPIPHNWETSIVETSSLVVRNLPEVANAYFTTVSKILAPLNPGLSRCRFVYTPMHGVGLPYMKRSVKEMGIADEDMIIVEDQAQPDADFSTVRFPNPEERGALDLAIAKADKHDVNIVIATDPDADRFAAAEKKGDTWHIFSGNNLGILLAMHHLESIPRSYPKGPAICTSVVSTRFLGHVAASSNPPRFHHEETLTGFKWLGNASLRLMVEGYGATFAFEESIGYMHTAIVADKDGVTAARAFLSLISVHGSPLDRLQSHFKRYGYFASANSYFTSPSSEHTAAFFNWVRSLGRPYPFPKTILESKKVVSCWRDAATLPLGSQFNPTGSGSNEMITVELGEDDTVFTVRGSGTEPKIKVYIEAVAKDEASAQMHASQLLVDLTREWFRPGETGLVPQE